MIETKLEQHHLSARQEIADAETEPFGSRWEALLLAAAGAFVMVNAVALSLAQEGRIIWAHLYAPLIWAVLIFVVQRVLHRIQPHRDYLLLPLMGLMSGWGIVLLDRLAPNFLNRQLLWLIICSGAMLAVVFYPRDLRFLWRFRYTWLIFGLILLVATLFLGVNPSGQGATLWLKVPLLGRVYFQPSELLKILLVIFLASYFTEQRQMLPLKKETGRLGLLVYSGPLVLMWGICIVFLVWQRDLGAATLFLAVFVTMLFLATGDWRYVLGGIILLAIAGIIGYLAFSVVRLRVDMWLNPWQEADSRGFQIVQSLYALASGGLTGQGIGQGFPTYVPVVHSDFAFAAIAEEWGLLGSLTIVACYAVLVYRAMRIASLSTGTFALFLSAGIGVIFGVQAILIMGGVTRLLPLTGVTLPFVSYGGSSLLISCLMIGLLLNLSRNVGIGRA